MNNHFIMGSETVHLFLSSSDSLHLYPNNNPTSFVCGLPEILYLPGKWKVALSEIYYFISGGFGDTDYICIFCDICQVSYVHNNFQPVLRRLPARRFREQELKHLYYIPVKTSFLKRIRLYILTETGETPSFIRKSFTCTLVLKRVG